MKDLLIVFAKEPAKDKVKTRLSRCLTAGRRLKLYKAFLKDTLNIVKNIRAEKILAYDSNKSPGYLRSIAGGLSLYKQRGRGLGQSMHNAFKFAKDNKASKIVIIGTDSPDLPVGFIRQAFKRLETKDVVLGPSRDGGYYLIGLKEPCKDIFSSVKGSTPQVFKKTIENCKRKGKKISLLKSWYDVDTKDELLHLMAKIAKDKKSAPWTKRALSSL